jgi:hypothetical protein
MNPSLEDMLHMYMMGQPRRWEEFLPLIEFTYNNSYQGTIKMAPFDLLFGKLSQTPWSFNQLEDRVLVGPDEIQELNAN